MKSVGKIQLIPHSLSEIPYFYRPSEEEGKKMGLIGKLRGDFDKDVKSRFWRNWEDINPEFKTLEFKDDFNLVMETLRKKELKTKQNLRTFLEKWPEAVLPNDGNWCGFHLHTDKYTYFFRLKTEPGDYNTYVWCYDKEKLWEFLVKD